MSSVDAPRKSGVWVAATPHVAVYRTEDGFVRYDIDHDRWLPVSSDRALPGANEAVWIESTQELLVWTGDGRGARYSPERDAWRPAAPPPEPMPAWTRDGPYASSAGALFVLFREEALMQHAVGKIYSPERDVWRELPPVPSEVTRTEPISWGVTCLNGMYGGFYYQPHFIAPDRWWFDERRFEWVHDALVGRPSDTPGCSARISDTWSLGTFDSPSSANRTGREGVVSLERVFRDRDVETFCSTLPDVGPTSPGHAEAFGRCILLWDLPNDWYRHETNGGRVCCMDANESWSCEATPAEPASLRDRTSPSIWTGEELLVFGGTRLARLPTPRWETEDGQVGYRRAGELHDGFILRPAPVAPGRGVPMVRCDARGVPLEAATQAR